MSPVVGLCITFALASRTSSPWKSVLQEPDQEAEAEEDEEEDDDYDCYYDVALHFVFRMGVMWCRPGST